MSQNITDYFIAQINNLKTVQKQGLTKHVYLVTGNSSIVLRAMLHIRNVTNMKYLPTLNVTYIKSTVITLYKNDNFSLHSPGNPVSCKYMYETVIYRAVTVVCPQRMVTALSMGPLYCNCMYLTVLFYSNRCGSLALEITALFVQRGDDINIKIYFRCPKKLQP